MRTLFCALFILLFATNCTNTSKKEQPKTQPGADKNERGCIPSAGYRWSGVLKMCIKPFEEGVQFVNYGVNADSTLAAYVVSSKDHKQVEIFSPKTKKPLILSEVKVIEGDIAPILFENQKEEMAIVRSKDVFYIRYKKELIYTANKLYN